MKKLLTIAALGIIATAANTAQALTWEVKCIKQGPARGYVAGHLKPGGVAKSPRVLDPNCSGSPCWTTGTPVNGYPVAPRSIPAKALVAEQSDITGDMNFISLGFGGQIVMRSNEWIGNGPGADITLFETTWGDPTCRPANSEQALVEVSEDGVNWVTPGTITNGPGGAYNTCYNGSFDISPLMRAQYVRITDRTNPAWNVRGDGVDGFDVDGLTANYAMPTTGNTPPSNNVICDYRQGVASQFAGMGMPSGTGIVAQRKDFSKANINEAGFPAAALTNPGLRDSGPASGSYNFWSLGFGGYACFQLPYTVFNGPGNDIFSFETTWNNQPCPSYNEKANVRVSADGINWSSPVTICKDALSIPGASPAIDLAAFGPAFAAVNYIRYDEASSPSDFGGGADGYDIDNIYLAQMPPPPPGTQDPGFSCTNSMSIRQAIPSGAASFMEGGVPEEMFALEIVGGNLVSDKISFTATIAEEGGYTYSIRSATGQEVLSGDFAGTLFSTPVAEIATSKLNNGVYFLTLTSATGKETVKFVKN